MFMRVSSILVALALVGLAAGCSESPTAQFESGKTTIENARLAEAEQYAPELFKQATDSLNAASVEMQKQDGKFSVLRDYDQAKATIVAAQQLAEKAQIEAAAEKERVRLADSSLIVEIESLIAETRQAITKAPAGKGSRVDLKVMKADLDAAVVALASATEGYQAGSYLTAKNELEAVKAVVTRVKSDIDAAVTRLKTN